MYDDHNLLVRAESPLGAVSTYEYDTHGVCIAITEPSGNTTRFEYGPDYQSVLIRDDYGELETMEWDLERRLVQCRMVLCNAESYTYDPLGRVTSISLPTGGTVTLRLNAEGEVVAFVDTAGAETRYEVNPYGEVLAEIDSLGHRIDTEYDALGRQVRIRNAAGEEMRFEFDSLGQLVAQQFFDGRTERYAYNRRGELIQIEHADGTATRLEYGSAGLLAAVTPADDQETTFEYDEKGACTRAERAGVALVYEYDAEGRCILEDQGGVVLTRSYDASDNCVRLEVEGLGVRTYGYDRRNRLVDVVDFDGSRVQLRYDLRNRCLAWEDSSRTGLEFSHGPNDRVERCRLSAVTTEARWQYDAAGRVTQRSITDRPVLRYQYDLADRLRLRRVGTDNEVFDFSATDDLLVNPNGEVVGYDRGSNLRSAGVTQFELDARGRVVSRSTPRGKTTFVYDAEDYLTRVVGPDGAESAYRFDPFGRRLWKTTGDGQTRFIWNESELLAEVVDGQVSPHCIYLTDPDTGVIRSMVQQGDRAFLLTEPTGIPLVAHFGSGFEIEDEPHPWGKASLSGEEAARLPLRFAGQYADVDTGLHYNRHRFYDPDTGHYLTPDPIGIESALNLYSYVTDPINAFDPDGLAATTVKKYECKGKTKKPPAEEREVPETQEEKCEPSMGTSIHNDCINMLRKKAENAGYQTRADQKMAHGKRMRNRPDLVMEKGGKRIYVEWDYSPASRAKKHKRQICASDPEAVVYLVKIPQSTRYTDRLDERKTSPNQPPPKKRGKIERGKQRPSHCGIDQIPL
jgi:RHS repeat-associated protein